MKILTYFLFIGFTMIGFGLLIKPQFTNEIIWGIFMPWITSSLEVLILYQVFNKEVLKTTKVLIYCFIIKMILFGGFLLIRPKKSKIGIIPIAFAKRIKKKKVRIKGVQVLTHFGPTFGETIVSLINCTIASIALAPLEGL